MNNVTIESLLQHMVDITSHRDHAQLNHAVIAALQALSGASRVRLFGIHQLRDQSFMRLLAALEDGQLRTVEENQDNDQAGELLAHYPVLANGIRRHQASAMETRPDGQLILWLPVWREEKPLACLEISEPAQHTPRTLLILKHIVSVYRNCQNLLDDSERDSLTGLLNRKTFDDKLSRMVASSARQERSLQSVQPERRQQKEHKEQWLAVIDIDHFKRVNDQFGHLYGDEVLILMANLLRASFRPQDRVFRFGGEEFVVLLRSTTLGDARRIFERFRCNVENYDFPQVGRVTVSIGFASIGPSEIPVAILGHADQALYFVKSHGRNHIRYYDELIQSGQLQAQTSHENVALLFDTMPPL